MEIPCFRLDACPLRGVDGWLGLSQKSHYFVHNTIEPSIR